MPEGRFTRWALATVLAFTPLLLTAQNDDGPILRPHKTVPQPGAAAAATLLVMCDLSCNWSLDGEPKGRIEAGASTKAKTGLGQHVVIATTEDGLDRIQQIAEVKGSGQTAVTLELKPLRAARLATESKATLLVTCDLACNWKLDGESKGHIEAGGSAKASVELGEHVVAAVTEDGQDSAEVVRSYKETGQALVRIDLNTVRATRLAAQARASADAMAREAARHEQERFLQKQQGADLGDTWTDPASGLMWQKRDNARNATWHQATEYCKNLRLSGYSDWRLPEIDELQAVWDPKHQYSLSGQLELSSYFLWSNSRGSASGEAWFFHFLNGRPVSATLDTSGNLRALCVRRPGK